MHDEEPNTLGHAVAMSTLREISNLIIEVKKREDRMEPSGTLCDTCKVRWICLVACEPINEILNKREEDEDESIRS